MKLWTFKRDKLIRLGYDLATVCAVAQHCDENGATIDEEDPKWIALRDATIAKRKGIRGPGDVLAAAIKVATLGKIKPCSGCNQRREKMN